jgi:hypothetical protein
MARNFHPSHPTKKVKHASGKSIDIDELLAPLVKLVWARRLTTYSCCQEERPGLACIEFAGSQDVEEFLFIAQQNYHVRVETWDEGEWPIWSIRVRLLVLFPMKAIALITKRFEEAPASGGSAGKKQPGKKTIRSK